jgi:hypothetical protein
VRSVPLLVLYNIIYYNIIQHDINIILHNIVPGAGHFSLPVHHKKAMHTESAAAATEITIDMNKKTWFILNIVASVCPSHEDL